MTSVWLFVTLLVTFMCNSVLGAPVAVPDALADPQLQYQPQPLSKSSQQFTMYKQLSQARYPPGPGLFQQYPPGPGPFNQYPPGVRLSPSGQPLQPISHYSYNITHPPVRPGIILTHHQLQHLSHQQRLQDRPQLSPSALQSQQRPAYTPVIIGNPNAVNVNPQVQPQNIIRKTSENAEVELQIPLQDLRERDPEDSGIGFRLLHQKKKFSGRVESSSNIVFDQRTPNQKIINEALRFPEPIVFGSGQGSPNQLGPLPPARQPYAPLQFPQNISATAAPVIQVPYITTLSPLQNLLQKKKAESQQAGFRSLLVAPNPGLQASLASTINRNNILLSSAGRGPRVQNFVVPNFGQTPASTQLLQNPGLQQQQRGLIIPPSNLYSNQGQGSPIPSSQVNQVPQQQRSFANQINPSLIRGTSITPENQRFLGQFVFTDPSGNDPNNPNTNNPNIDLANAVEKTFILPPQSPPNTGLNQNNSDDPAEIVVTVVDDSPGSEFTFENGSKDSSIKQKGKVLTNFSLFLVPSTYKRCFEGYRKAHDGKCRLIIKLRSRYSG